MNLKQNLAPTALLVTISAAVFVLSPILLPKPVPLIAHAGSLSPTFRQSPANVAPVVQTRTEVKKLAPQTASKAPSSRSGACDLAYIKEHESGGDYGAISSSGKYRGAYQFDQRTWESNGGTGDPATASPAEQDRVAAATYARRGSQPWSVCH